MPHLFDTLIRLVTLIDGSGAAARLADVALRDGRIARIDEGGAIDPDAAAHVVEGHGLVLAPGFIDVHTHDDTNVVRQPEMTPKLSQGVTTVIVGNCGISAAPVTLSGDPPDPMNLLGHADAFRYPSFKAYVDARVGNRPIRYYTVGDAITMDFNPARLNVVLGKDGRIQRLRCG